MDSSLQQPVVLLACPVHKQRNLLGTWRQRLVEIVHVPKYDYAAYDFLVYKSAGDMTAHQVVQLDSVSLQA